MTKECITICDVGPRDGLQNQNKIVDRAGRLQLIRTLMDAGLPEIEVGSFVSPKAVPAMAGTDSIASELLSESSQQRFSALVPNRRGYDAAVAAGVKVINLVTAASDSMNKNVTTHPLAINFPR